MLEKENNMGCQITDCFNDILYYFATGYPKELLVYFDYYQVFQSFIYDNLEQKVYAHEQYFYDPDHLGSSSFITDADGEGYQHLQYLPFGETSVSQKISWWSTPYQFTGKEKDDETGYNYFGARYYNSDVSIWLSVDPLSDKYPSMSAYMYCAGNPVMLVDPDGRWIKGAGFFKNVFWSDAKINAKRAAHQIPGAVVSRRSKGVWVARWEFDANPSEDYKVYKIPDRATLHKGYGFAEYRNKERDFVLDRWARKLGDFLKDSKRLHAYNDVFKYGSFQGIRDLKDPMISPTDVTHLNVITAIGASGTKQPTKTLFQGANVLLVTEQALMIANDINDHGITSENAYNSALIVIGATGPIGAMGASTAESYRAAGNYIINTKVEADRRFENIKNWGWFYGL